VALAIWACAPTLPRPFQEARAAAERSYAAGRYDEAADRWLEAEKAASRPRDKNEARYRAAVSLRRAGRGDEATKLLSALLKDSPKSSRTARAEFDLADMEIEKGNRQQGFAALESAVRRHPNSGLAPLALARLASFHEESGGPEAALSYLEAMRTALARTELEERASFLFAKKLDQTGKSDRALAEYLALTRKFPYPQGALWDDALWYASLIEERLGRPERAVQHLQKMLAEREPSSLQGSYERPRYAAARFRIAELFRDRLADPARARREFRRVYDEHPTSPLRDDALWNEARLAHAAGDRDGACSAVETLVEHFQDSRYAPCARALCASVEPGKGACHAYVLRALDSRSED